MGNKRGRIEGQISTGGLFTLGNWRLYAESAQDKKL